MKHILFCALFGPTILGFCQVKPNVRSDSVKPFSNPTHSHRIDSLEKALEGANQEDRFNMQLQLFGNYMNSDSGKAVFYLRKCLDQAALSGDSLWIVKSSNGKGWMLKNKGDLKEAIRTFEYSLEIAKRNNFKQEVKYLSNNLALTYTESAAYDKALHYNFESLRVREKDGDSTEISIALNNIAFAYSELGDYESALNYFEKSYRIKMRNNIRYDLERSVTNIGGILIELGKYEEAEKIIKQAFIICDSSDCRNDILEHAYRTFGVALFNQNKQSESERYFRKSLELAQTIGLSKLTAANFYWLASVKYERNQIDSAINFLDRSQRIVNKYSLPKITLENYQLYTKIYTQKKDYQRALNYQRLYNQLSTEILNGDLIGKISRIQIDKEQRENTSKLVSQAAIMTFQEESLQRHRVLNVLIGAVGILTMGLAIMLYKINRHKQKVNGVLDQLVKERTFELKNNRDELKRAHDGQTLITNKLSSDLVSSLATLRGLSNMASKDLPQEQRVYFNEVEAMAEKLVNQVNKYSLPG